MLPKEITKLLDEHLTYSTNRAKLHYDLAELKALRDMTKSSLWLKYRKDNTLVETDHLLFSDERLLEADSKVRQAELAYELEDAHLQNTYRRLAAHNSVALSLHNKNESVLDDDGQSLSL